MALRRPSQGCKSSYCWPSDRGTSRALLLQGYCWQWSFWFERCRSPMLLVRGTKDLSKYPRGTLIANRWMAQLRMFFGLTFARFFSHQWGRWCLRQAGRLGQLPWEGPRRSHWCAAPDSGPWSDHPCFWWGDCRLWSHTFNRELMRCSRIWLF